MELIIRILGLIFIAFVILAFTVSPSVIANSGYKVGTIPTQGKASSLIQ